MARTPRILRPQPVIDLHSPELDMTGRVDVLVARSLRKVVEVVPDPMLKIFYHQFQPVIDLGIQKHLGKYNIAATLRSLGLAKPAKPKVKRRRPNRGEVL